MADDEAQPPSADASADAALSLPEPFIEAMVTHAQQDEPNECCGIIGRFPDGRLKLFRATNAEASPYRFNIGTQELLYLYNAIEGAGGDMLVIYHSHTMSEARPSPTDLNIARMHKGPNLWPYWVLVSLAEETPAVRVWRIDDDGDGEVVAAEVRLNAGDTPDGSECVRLATSERAGKASVEEVAL